MSYWKLKKAFGKFPKRFSPRDNWRARRSDLFKIRTKNRLIANLQRERDELRAQLVPKTFGLRRRVPSVFIVAMEEKLFAGALKGRNAWEAHELQGLADELLGALQSEVHELMQAVGSGASTADILREAADVANFAMMVADSVGAIADARR